MVQTMVYGEVKRPYQIWDMKPSPYGVLTASLKLAPGCLFPYLIKCHAIETHVGE
jgi:hypothetical protein